MSHFIFVGFSFAEIPDFGDSFPHSPLFGQFKCCIVLEKGAGQIYSLTISPPNPLITRIIHCHTTHNSLHRHPNNNYGSDKEEDIQGTAAAPPESHLSAGQKHKKSVTKHKMSKKKDEEESKKKDDKAIGTRKSAPESYDSESVSGVAAAAG